MRCAECDGPLCDGCSQCMGLSKTAACCQDPCVCDGYDDDSEVTR